MKKRKLLFIKKRFNAYGGAELYLHGIINILQEKYDISIISENWPQIPGIRIYRIKKSRFLPALFFILQIKNFLKRNKQLFDITISFDRCIDVDIFRASDGCHAKWLEQRKLFEHSIKTLANNLSLKHNITLWLEKRTLETCKKIIVNSSMVKREFEFFYGKHVLDLSKKISLCYNGINLQKFYPIDEPLKQNLRKQFGMGNESVILFVGSGYKRKGIDIIINSLKTLPKKTKVLIIGKDKNLKFYREKYRKYQNIAFLGPQKNTLPFYQMSDIFILPTYYDPFANTTLEALACGLPVITSIYNGAHEIIQDGKEGFTIDIKKSVNLKPYIIKILANKKHLKKMTTKKAKHFDLNKIIKRFHQEIVI